MLSTEAVSAHIDIPVATLNTWRSLGKGPVFYQLGKLIRYRLSDVEFWINSNRRGPDESQETQREIRRRCSPWPLQPAHVPSERKG